MKITEEQLRQQVVNTATAWMGCKASDGSHRKIIDLYNAHTPLARGYKVTYTDAWCATFASAVAIKCGLTDIMPTECSCTQLIALYKKLGRWQEDDAYVPSPGDLIMYDWDDTGAGDCTGAPEHVGIVAYLSGTSITVIEGNKGNAVGYRTLNVDSRYIRGYCTPDYAGKAAELSAAAEREEIDMSKEELKSLIRETVREVLDEENPVYKDLKDVPEYWRSTAAALLDAGAVNGGTPAEVCATDLNLRKETLQAVVISAMYHNVRADKQ